MGVKELDQSNHVVRENNIFSDLSFFEIASNTSKVWEWEKQSTVFHSYMVQYFEEKSCY